MDARTNTPVPVELPAPAVAQPKPERPTPRLDMRTTLRGDAGSIIILSRVCRFGGVS